ncbi:hypothetical protein D3C84_880080 [compost metagenome]
MPILYPHRPQQVFGLQGIQPQWVRLQCKQVNHRHAVQAQMLFREGKVVLPALSQHDIDVKPRQPRRQGGAVQATQRHEHEFLAEGEILQQ